MLVAGRNQKFRNFLAMLFGFGVVSFFIISQSLLKIENSVRIDINSVLFSVLNISLAIIGLAYSLHSKYKQFNMAFLWVFQLVFFGIGGLLTQIDPFPYYLGQLSDKDFFMMASEMIFIAQIAIILGQIYAASKGTIRDNPLQLDFETLSILSRRVKTAIVLYLLLLPLLLQQLGGVGFLAKRTRISNTTNDLSISRLAIIQTFLYVPPVITGLLCNYLSKNFAFSKKILVLNILWLVVLTNPFGNARQTTLFIILPFLYVFLQKKSLLAYLFYLILPLMFIYSAGSVDRYSGRIALPKFSILSRDGDFDAFSQLANGIQIVSDETFPILHQILGSLFFFVPRDIWEGKPQDTGVLLAQILRLRFQNLSAPWILELFVNFRLIGVVFFALIIGYIISRIDLNSSISLNNQIFGAILSGLLFILLRGSLLQATGRAVFCFCLAYLLLRKLKHEEV